MNTSFLDYFTQGQFSDDRDLLYKAKLLSGLVLAFTAALCLFMLFFLLNPGFSLQERLSGVIPTGLLACLYGGLLFMMKHKGQFYLCAHMLIASTYLNVAAGVFLTGGPFQTPTATLLVLPAFLAFCLLNRRQGMIWSCVVLFVHVMAMLLDSLITYPNVTQADMQDITRGFNWLIAFFALVALMYISETMSMGLRQERDAEKNRYKNVAEIASDNDVMHKASLALLDTSKNLFNSTQAQQVAVSNLATTTQELSASADLNSQLTRDALQEIKNNDEKIKRSEDNIANLSSAISDIRILSNEIKKITDMVSDIAYQTNLLSLNAMIEASRAGAENSGFGVVALEVQKLAERSSDAVDEINKLLERNNFAVIRGVESSEKIQDNVNDIAANAKPLANTIYQVSEASQEQNQAIYQIVSTLDNFSEALDNNNVLANENSQLAQELRQSAAQLSEAFAMMKSS